jgi:hypothetical protein
LSFGYEFGHIWRVSSFSQPLNLLQSWIFDSLLFLLELRYSLRLWFILHPLSLIFHRIQHARFVLDVSNAIQARI